MRAFGVRSQGEDTLSLHSLFMLQDCSVHKHVLWSGSFIWSWISVKIPQVMLKVERQSQVILQHDKTRLSVERSAYYIWAWTDSKSDWQINRPWDWDTNVLHTQLTAKLLNNQAPFYLSEIISTQTGPWDLAILGCFPFPDLKFLLPFSTFNVCKMEENET